jgi:hypothetical protein
VRPAGIFTMHMLNKNGYPAAVIYIMAVGDSQLESKYSIKSNIKSSKLPYWRIGSDKSTCRAATDLRPVLAYRMSVLVLAQAID